MTRRLPLLLLAALLGCDGRLSDPEGHDRQPPCPSPSGEFPPAACAFISGVLTRAGAPVAGTAVFVSERFFARGDSGTRYQYLSAVESTDAAGRFELLVWDVPPITQLSLSDTATLYVQIGINGGHFPRGHDSVAVLLRFFPLGTVADTVRATLALP